MGGVSALLDELLSEDAAVGAHDGVNREEAFPSPELHPSMSKGETSYSWEGPESLACLQVSPREQQLAELAGEVDACLATLERWEEDRRADLEALQKDLEQQDAVAGDNNGLDIADWELKDVDDPDEATRRDPAQVVCHAFTGRLHTDSPSIVRSEASASRAQSPAAPRLAAMQASEEAMRHHDEKRIAALRVDLERLRGRDAELQQEFAQASVHTASDLAALCQEADCVLGEVNITSLRTGQADVGDTADFSTVADLETQLVQAQRGLSQLEGTMNSACSHVDSEIAELERLLNDRDGDLPLLGPGLT